MVNGKVMSGEERARESMWQMGVLLISILIIVLLGGLFLIFSLFTFNKEVNELYTQLANPCSVGLYEDGCDADHFSLWCKEAVGEADDVPGNSQCKDYCNGLSYPFDGLESQQDKFCKFKTVCQAIGTRNKEFARYCSTCKVESVYEGLTPIGLCDAFDFNQLCFNNSNLRTSCIESCHYPETLPDDFENYVYCSILQEYKYLSPCFESFLDPICQSNEKVQNIFCVDNIEYCPLVPDNAGSKYVSACYCRCLQGGDNCNANLCDNFLTTDERRRICGN